MQQQEDAIKEALALGCFADEFTRTTELHKAIRKVAAQVQGLNPMYGNNWLKALCINYGANEIEGLTDIKTLKELLKQVENKENNLLRAFNQPVTP